MKKESPEYVRLSLAAAIVLGFKGGLFYRNASSPCINLLLTYERGCAAACAYCGLSAKRPGAYAEKSFIRVPWEAYEVAEITRNIARNMDRVKRVCLSMITHKKSADDTVEVMRAIKRAVDVPISVLAAPTILGENGFRRFKENGADRIGIAVDAATPALFQKYRGAGVQGPHTWERYWRALEQAVEVFGEGHVGVHLIVGLGESEEEMIATIQTAHDRGIATHLFSFFPEADSSLASLSPPPAGRYRRVQLARYVINAGLARRDNFVFDRSGRLVDYGLPEAKLPDIVESGKPFTTSGCPGTDGDVACNRPYSDSLPGPDIRSFPFAPTASDIKKIKEELAS